MHGLNNSASFARQARPAWLSACPGASEQSRTEALSRAGVTPVIPPPAHAVVHGGEDTRWHDEIVKYIQDKGIYAFHKKYGYGLRARVEAQISRIKRCIGATLLTQKIASPECEGVVIANLINLWNAFGNPVCVKNA